MTLKIGTNLKRLMSEKNLSMRELSKRTGVPYSKLQEWCGDRSPKNPIQIQKVASFFGVTIGFNWFKTYSFGN